jgi:hypothetical protein
MRLTCAVNGERFETDLDWEGESLLYVLHERLRPPGSKTEELARIPRAVAVLGDHDWNAAGPAMGWALREAGVALLENDALEVRPGLWIAGVADLRHRSADLSSALRKHRDGDGVVLVVHDPDFFPKVPARVNLTVAGHLHGGQLNIPILRRAAMPTRYGDRYLAGHVVEGGRHLYVGSGLGTSGMPLRLRRAGGPRAHPDARSAQDSSSVTCSGSRPVDGSVRTSSVRPGRAAAHASQDASRSSSIQASGASGPTRASIAASFQWRVGFPTALPNVRCDQPPGRPSRRGRCSSARSSQPVHQTHSKVRARRASSRPACGARKWGIPSTAVGNNPAGGASGKPNNDSTPSTSTRSWGRPLQLSTGMDVSLSADLVLKKHATGTDELEYRHGGSRGERGGPARTSRGSAAPNHLSLFT